MRKFLHRFIWKNKDERFVPFLIFFTLQNLVIGLVFAFGFYIPGVTELPLFNALARFLPDPFTAVIWGVGLIVVFVGHCLEMWFRGAGWGPPVAMSGFLLWVYAFYVYSSIFYIMGMVAISAPQIFFWSWYYFEAKKYRREVKVDDLALDI